MVPPPSAKSCFSCSPPAAQHRRCINTGGVCPNLHHGASPEESIPALSPQEGSPAPQVHQHRGGVAPISPNTLQRGALARRAPGYWHR
eukprot:scaffold26339_cov56-Isochrysis_galbana.AAC.1